MIKNKELNKEIIRIAKKLDMRKISVLAFLHYLSIQDSTKTKLLIRMTGQPKGQIQRLLKSFSEFLKKPSQSVVVKKEYKEIIRNFSKDKIKQIKSVNTGLIKELLLKYNNYKPVPKREFDQFYATMKTVVKRTLMMAEEGDLWQREIVFLGDDDLTSIAVALTRQAKRIVIFEIDERIGNLITEISRQEKLNIEVIKHDLRKTLPEQYLNSFDTVFTDPPYTSRGISVFLNKSIELIKNRYTSRTYLCYGNSNRAREREVDIQRLITDKGFLVHSKLYQFNKYYEADSIGSSSSLYLLDWTPRVKITKVDFAKFYTNE